MARKLTPGEMVGPKAIAPFEALEAFKLWDERWNATDLGPLETMTWQEREAAIMAAADGLGPPNKQPHETTREWAERSAVALFTLIMEI